MQSGPSDIFLNKVVNGPKKVENHCFAQCHCNILCA